MTADAFTAASDGDRNPGLPPFVAKQVTPEMVAELERLIGQQAEEHECAFLRNTEALRAAIDPPNPRAYAHLVFDPADSEKALAYMFYSTVWAFEGKTAYLEDICADKNHRGKCGVGSFAMNAFFTLAAEHDCNRVAWSVMENNKRAIRFYLKHCVLPVPKKSYDMDNLLEDETALPDPGICRAERIEGPHAAIPEHLAPAAFDPNTGLFAVKGDTGDPAAILLMNANFSTFRGVTGLLVEPVKFIRPADDGEKRRVLSAAFRAVCAFARENGFTGHIYAAAKERDIVANDFLNSAGRGRLKMNDNPESVFMHMARMIVCSTPRNSFIPKQPL
ncbi:MAG: GNAT family N-acetyltransferase [Proteobacteria bacterium]|nr:GNAT family N-acetyltransferase [Pseudomonadota bacterium]